MNLRFWGKKLQFSLPPSFRFLFVDAIQKKKIPKKLKKKRKEEQKLKQDGQIPEIRFNLKQKKHSKTKAEQKVNNYCISSSLPKLIKNNFKKKKIRWRRTKNKIFNRHFYINFLKNLRPKI